MRKVNNTAKNIENNGDMEFSGRKANVELGNFRLYAKSKHQQYFTSNEVSSVIYEMLLPMINKDEVKDISILDPACGSGRLLVPWKKAGAKVVGIELDKETALVAKRLIGKSNVRVGDVLDYVNHLENFNIVITNPPYGIRWQIDNVSYGFESSSYGDSIESQSATIEIGTKALGYKGILAAIIPDTTFINSKDSGLRKHLYDNYDILLKATLKNAFKGEYKLGIDVSLVIAKRAYKYGEKKEVKSKEIEVDIINDDNWKTVLIDLMKESIEENNLEMEPEEATYVPYLNNLGTVNVNNPINITCRGISGEISEIALLDFTNRVLEEYNPIQGTQTGIIDAYLSSSTMIKRGVESGQRVLEQLGFSVSITEKDRKRIEMLKKKYEFLSTPLHQPKSHQLLAYFYDKEYEANKTVEKDGKVIFKAKKKYFLHPSWVRRRMTINVADGINEKTKKKFTVKTEVDQGYLSIKIITEQGEMTFNEIKVDDIKLFTKAFPLPEVKDIADKYPERVKYFRKKIEAECSFLFEYQKEDLSRLALKPFGYIGYEMGGGKTVSAASWAKLRGYKNVLIVCQSGLVNNWINELEKFGFNADRLTTHQSIDRIKKLKKEKDKQSGTKIYVTSYEFISIDTARKYDSWDCIEYDKDGNIRRASKNNKSLRCPLCHKSYQSIVKDCPKCNEHELWTGNKCHKCGYIAYAYTSGRKTYPAYKRIKKLFNAVIVDEAQISKTKNSMRGRAVRALKSKGKLLLTGTLMKGYITDLYFNVGWLIGHGNPLFPYNYYGGSKLFLNEFGTFEYVTKQFEETLSEGKARLIPEVSNLNRFWRILGSFTIRRLKDQMIELPKKNKHIIFLPMDKEHSEIYNEYQEWAKKTITKALRNSDDGKEVNMGVISRALWKLRFAATVPNAENYLCDENCPGRALPYSSWNKIKKTMDLIRDIKNKGEKVIVFSGLRPMVSAICKELRLEGIGYTPILATHKTGSRFDKIQEFSNNGDTAIVTGLNVLNRGFTITAANNVILTDLEWSPEATLQAEDRAHRTGQEKDVNIYYLFSEGTIDEDMFELISKKHAAISNAIDGKAMYDDVAKLLEGMRGNIQLEVARRIEKAVPVMIKETKKPEQKTITTNFNEQDKIKWDELYQQKIRLLKERRKRKPKKEYSPDQMMLFTSM